MNMRHSGEKGELEVFCRCRWRIESWRVPLVVSSLAEGVAQPFQPFVETVAGSGASGLNVLGRGQLQCLGGGSNVGLPKRVASKSVDQVCQ